MTGKSSVRAKLSAICKRQHVNVTVVVKTDVIKCIRNGERAADIAYYLGLPPTTVHTIAKNTDDIMEKARHLMQHSSVKIAQQRSKVMEMMETMMAVWLDGSPMQNMLISLNAIQEKAVRLFKFLKDKEKQEMGGTFKEETFNASCGWFQFPVTLRVQEC
ncbi:putative CENPB DNA-binding domain-containing protein 1 [Carettochelys insculpta]|uniref:putative CENPB DNA-binding domain-containing protein 1 n=1 Tax=Carettochelys insculpta TaxID=44489 RepID=UPI003EBC9845